MAAVSPEAVCFLDGWHYAVVQDADGADVPGDRLVLEDDGSYRLATDADTETWHDRKHIRYATVELEDGTASVRVTAEEMEAIRQMLDEKRGNG